MKRNEAIKELIPVQSPISQEFKVNIGLETKKVFVHDGFYNTASKQIIHTHSYAELHVFLGKARLSVNDTVYTLSGATLALIPRDSYHTYSADRETKHSAFQIDMDARFEITSVSEELLNEFFTEIKHCRESENYSRISAYVSFFCSYFLSDTEKSTVAKITDYRFLINEFLSLRYIEDIKLSDLADALSVSEKQAHRLVIKHTGNTFGYELASRRMRAAEQLMKSGRYSMTEIAESVGYQTYSGFWKAYRRYKQEELEAQKAH